MGGNGGLIEILASCSSCIEFWQIFRIQFSDSNLVQDLLGSVGKRCNLRNSTLISLIQARIREFSESFSRRSTPFSLAETSLLD
ncbi:hypothetical protein KSP39_PZI000889 [Platanthera zijinensis]|uniref:Uncharacterized protein n=1 Tax=Platanthera zijinensis TaxID=2320716 RepID=A0AAP0C3C8_9ASPA